MRRTIYALLTTVALTSLLGGCGFIHRHFDRKDDSYKKSVNERPLEVPPDLDTPNSSGALVVPAAGAAAGAAAGSAPIGSATPPGTDASGAALAAAAPAGGVAIGGDSIVVTDNVDNTWSRVGLALERSGAAKILSRDQASATYTVQTTGQTTTKPGWFKRAITLGMAGGKTTAQVQLTVRVSAEGSTGCKVGIEGANDEASQDAARALLATLRQRLS